MTPAEILDAQEGYLKAQGTNDAVIEPRMHLIPDPAFRGHFNVLRGYIASLGITGVKIVGDFIDNYQIGLPSEFATLNLMDAHTGTPKGVIDATAITDTPFYGRDLRRPRRLHVEHFSRGFAPI